MQARVPQLDGVRGLAVLLVVGAHVGGLGLPFGGTTGVTLFFVLSGYLITGLLLGELDRKGSIDLRAFWKRRARRLVPALLLFIPVAAVLLAGETGIRVGLVVALVAPVMDVLRVTGVQLVGFGHLWSLSVEEQFYLLWPLALGWLLRGRGRLVSRLGWAVCAFVAWRCLLLLFGLDSWAYFGPDANAYALLLGAVGAAAVRAGVVVPAWAGYVAFPILFMVAATPLSPSVGLWVQPVAAVAGVVVVTSAGSLPGLGWSPLRYAGRISYGLYLWHVPVLWLFEDRALGWRLGGAAIAIAVASASFELVERRFLARSPAPRLASSRA